MIDRTLKGERQIPFTAIARRSSEFIAVPTRLSPPKAGVAGSISAGPRQTITSVAAGQFRSEAGADLPQFVKDEFDAFLECGILAHGFLRLRCGDCGHDKLIAILCPLIKEFLAAPAP